MKKLLKKGKLINFVALSSSQSGFTLVELLIVMAIIAILVGVAIAGIGFANMRSRNNQRLSALNNVDKALISFYDEHTYFPSSLSNSFDEVLNTYLDDYMEGSWEAPSGTTVYYRTDAKGVSYMTCFSIEQYGTGDVLYTCKGSGIGKTEGNWPQSSMGVDCLSPTDPVDCGAGPLEWNPVTQTWDY